MNPATTVSAHYTLSWQAFFGTPADLLNSMRKFELPVAEAPGFMTDTAVPVISTSLSFVQSLPVAGPAPAAVEPQAASNAANASTLDQLTKTALDRYITAKKALIIDKRRLTSTYNWLMQYLGECPIDALTDEVPKYIDARTKTVTLQTVRRELVTLRAALRMAWERRKILAVPPFIMPPRGKPNQRVLNYNELRRLDRAVRSDPELALFDGLGFGTGARREAIMELTHDRVDMVLGVINFNVAHPLADRRKNRAVVPMSPRLLELMREARKAALKNGASLSDRIFTVSVSTMYRRFKEAAARAKMPKISPHVMRHTLATHLLRKVPTKIASLMIGHRAVASTAEVYGHLNTGDLRPAARAADTLLPGSRSAQRGRRSVRKTPPQQQESVAAAA